MNAILKEAEEQASARNYEVVQVLRERPTQPLWWEGDFPGWESDFPGWEGGCCEF